MVKAIEHPFSGEKITMSAFEGVAEVKKDEPKPTKILGGQKPASQPVFAKS